MPNVKNKDRKKENNRHTTDTFEYGCSPITALCEQTKMAMGYLVVFSPLPLP